MNTKFAAVTALAGGLLLLASLQGTAYSASLPILNSPHNGVTLVGHGGGGGGAGHGGGGSGAMAHAGGMGGARGMNAGAMAHAGGMRAMAHTGGMGGGRNMHAGAMAHNGGTGRQHFAEGPHGSHFDRGDRDRFVAREAHSHK